MREGNRTKAKLEVLATDSVLTFEANGSTAGSSSYTV